MNSEIQRTTGINQKIYRFIFWLGYAMVLAVAFVHLKKDLHGIIINIVSFKFHFDQVLHTVIYLLICLYFTAGQYLGLTLFKENSFIKFILIVLILATVSEAIQLFVPSRAFNFFDWLANVIGIVIGMMVIKSVKVRRM